jgi:hypothetical protein
MEAVKMRRLALVLALTLGVLIFSAGLVLADEQPVGGNVPGPTVSGDVSSAVH